MNRRDLNRILMLGTALAGGWPVWLRRAFGAEATPLRTGLSPSSLEAARRWRHVVLAAHRRARLAGKPLLAFVVPPADDDSGAGYEARWQRGRAFGELLNHGGDQALATLALAEIVCAPMEALRSIVPTLPVKDSLMVLIETDAAPAQARLLHAALPDGLDTGKPARLFTGLDAGDSWSPPDWDTIFREQFLVEEEAIQHRIETLVALLEAGLRATPRMLLERAAQAEARLRMDARAEILPVTAGPAHIHRMAAILLAAVAGMPDRDRQPAVARVADAARSVLCRRRVPGSRWADTA